MSVLLTGATGFVGMEVLARLLSGGEEVACLVRGDDPDARLAATLDLMGVAPAERELARALPGGLDAPIPAADADVVVHCAASVSFALPLAEARRINVAGTARAVEAAMRADARLVHVSTAYVAGRARGRFAETERRRGQAFRNTYEQSKLEAEELVEASGVDAVILRPSIVMGEAATGWTPAFNVLYWPLRAFDRGLIDAVPAPPGALVDVVPVDFVADAIAHVATERPDVRGVLHLVAGDGAVTVAQLTALAAETLGRERPVLGSADRALADRSDEAARYVEYFDVEVSFDDARARAVLAPAGIVAPPLEAYFGRLMDFARRTRWGKRPLSRPELLTTGGIR